MAETKNDRKGAVIGMEKNQQNMSVAEMLATTDTQEEAGENRETEIQAAENPSESLKTMQQMERQLTEHIDRYMTLSDNICQEVDDRRKNRTTLQYLQKRRQAMIKRILWCIFLVLCCAVAYLLYSTQYDLLL